MKTYKLLPALFLLFATLSTKAQNGGIFYRQLNDTVSMWHEVPEGTDFSHPVSWDNNPTSIYVSFDDASSHAVVFKWYIDRYDPSFLVQANSDMNWFLRKGGQNSLGDTIANLDSYWGSPDTMGTLCDIQVNCDEGDTLPIYHINHNHTGFFITYSNHDVNSVDSCFTSFRKDLGDNNYLYAWIRWSRKTRMDSVIPSPNIYRRFYRHVCVIHDYAYCTIPNYPLRIGQTSFDWGVEENKNTFTIYPNPTTGKACIALPENNNAINKIEVCNTLGAIVLETANMQGNTLDVSSLPAGVYIVRIVTDDGKQRFGKLVKK